MSLILDALRRAEHERKKSQPVPDLQTVHDPLPLSSPIPAKKPLRPWLVLLALVLLALGAYYVYQRQDQPLPEPVEKSTPLPKALGRHSLPSAREDIQGTSPPKVEKSVRESAAGAPPAEVRDPGRQGASAPADLAALYASAREEENPPQEDPVKQLYAPPPAPAVTESASQPIPAAPEVRADTTPASEDQVLQTLPDPAPLPDVADKTYESLVDIPDIGDLPWSFRKEIPTINYVRHNFLPQGAKSVVINGRPHQAGSALAPDLVLEEIYVDGSLFRYKQIRFKLRALNSWVNM